MRKLYLLFFCCALLMTSCAARTESFRKASLNPETWKSATSADKLLVVVGDGDSSQATLLAFEKQNGHWKERLRSPAVVGRNGIRHIKREGDGVTPAGFYTLGRAFGTAKDPGALLPYSRLTAADLWVDDPSSRYYNQWVSRDTPDKDWNSAEELAKETTAYAYALTIGYNMHPVIKGAGSAIFLHCSTGRPTAGCVSVPEDMMVKLLRFSDDNTAMLIAPSTRELAGMAPKDR